MNRNIASHDPGTIQFKSALPASMVSGSEWKFIRVAQREDLIPLLELLEIDPTFADAREHLATLRKIVAADARESSSPVP